MKLNVSTVATAVIVSVIANLIVDYLKKGRTTT